jgi:hypothetical protein
VSGQYARVRIRRSGSTGCPSCVSESGIVRPVREKAVRDLRSLAAVAASAPATRRRVKFSAGNRTVINGPFAESKELVAGYWILQVKSMDEAVEWAKRVPFEALSRIYPGEYGAVGEIEIRQLFEQEHSDASN